MAIIASDVPEQISLPVRLSDEEIGREVITSNLKPLPQLEIVIPEGWKDAVYGPDGSGCP